MSLTERRNVWELDALTKPTITRVITSAPIYFLKICRTHPFMFSIQKNSSPILMHFIFKEDIHRYVSIIAYYSFNLNKIEYLTFFGDFLLFNQINEPFS